jgi:hypothetical protein
MNLEDINAKLRAIREKKSKLSRCKSAVKEDRIKRTNDEPKDFKTPSFKKKTLKLYHPDPGRVFGEVMYSPYLTRPNKQYAPLMYKVRLRLSIAFCNVGRLCVFRRSATLRVASVASLRDRLRCFVLLRVVPPQLASSCFALLRFASQYHVRWFAFLPNLL